MTAIQIRGLSFKRGTQFLFQNLDFVFPAHQFTLLIGDSGSGKSTLMKLIAGFMQLDFEGEILVQKRQQATLPANEKARQVGFVFQNPSQQFTMKTLRREMIFALENIQIAPEEMSHKMAKAAALMNTAHLLDREITSLSGGEKQRASLTVVLAMDPPILLLDEPFASIDPAARQAFIACLAQLRDAGKTIILCDHDLTGYHAAVDQIVLLEEGQLRPVSREILVRSPEMSVLKKSNEAKCPRLRLEKVSIKHQKQALLQVPQGTLYKGITALTGENGAGKSTLLRAIVQRQKYSGAMFLDGKKLRAAKKLYQKLTLAVQDADKQFVGLTPKEELAYGAKMIDSASAKQLEALEVLHLQDKSDRSLFHLSEGQKKMIQLISMLSLDLSFLLLDEPFTGLDENACRFFMSWITAQSNRQDFLIVSHRLAPLSGVSDHHFEVAEGGLHER